MSWNTHLFTFFFGCFKRILLTDPTPPENPILRITQNRRLFRVAILVALILGIASSTTTNSNGSSSSTANTLHIASTVIFLVVTVLQAVQTIYLASMRVSGEFYRKRFTISIKGSFFCFKDKTSTTNKAKIP